MPARIGLIGPSVATIIVLGIAGCSSTSAEVDTEPSRSTDASAQTPPTEDSLADQSTPSGSAGTDQPAPPPDGTSATVSRDDLLDALWEIADLEGERPDVDLIREVGDEDWSAVQTECLTEAGFPPFVDNGDVVGWEGTAEQADAFALADYTCQAQYPRKMEYLQPYSVDQLDLIYDWMNETTIPCLAAQGYDVPPVPSLESFRASYSPEGGFWTPDSEVPGGVPYAVQEICPHLPPQDVLYNE